MRYVQGVGPLLLAAALGCGGPDATTPGNAGSGIEIDGVRSQAPESWIEERPSQEMRFAQFRLPGAGGKDASLVVFRGIGGTPLANVKRWEDQFTDVVGESKRERLRIGHLDVVVLDIQGTYIQRDMRNQEAPPLMRPDYRMIAVHFDGGKEPFQIKLTGPARTIERHKAEFDKWLKGFK